MRFARPPTGFHIVLGPLAKTTLQSNSLAIPRLAATWNDIAARLKYTAHRDGLTIGENRFVGKFEGDSEFGIPSISIVYVVVGDRVEVEKMLVSL